MRKKHLVFGSVASVAMVIVLLVTTFAGAASVTADVEGDNSCITEGLVETSAVQTTRDIDFSATGDVAVFEVKVKGAGVLMVYTADFAPDAYPDYWRATIVCLREGAGAWALNDDSSTACAAPGGGSNPGPFTGVCDMTVVEGYTYLVIVSYDRGVDVWPAGVRILFRYIAITGAEALSVSANPRPGF